MTTAPMNLAPHRPETLGEMIFRHTQRMLRETRCSWEAFAQRAVEHYHATVPAEARDVQFKTEGDVFNCARINAQKLARYADDRVNARLPADLLEAWVNGLTEPYRADCVRDLARRFGLLAVPVPPPTSCPVSALQSMSAVSREFGGACAAIAPIIANGRFGPEDAAYADLAARELEQLLAAVTEMLNNVRAIKAPGGAV